MDRQTLLDLLPAYSLGVLDPEEREAVERLLAGDPEARILLAEYEAVSGQFGVMVPPRRAPEHLRADLRRRIAAEKPEQSRRRVWMRYGLAAAAVLAVILAGALFLRNRANPKENKTTPAQTYADISDQDNAQWYSVVPGDAGTNVQGALVATAAGDRAVIRVAQLPALDESQTFQMWLAGVDGTVRSGGIFRVEDESAFLEVPLEQPIASYKFIGVSLEPAGGSPYPDRPSGPRVFFVPIQQS